MAEVPIPNPTWLALLRRLGIQRFGAWLLSDRVVPVAIVDAGSVTISAAPLFGVPASAGEVANPVANTRLADTLALAAGNWTFMVWATAGENNNFRMRRRNAADAADIWSFLFRTGSATVPANNFFMTFRNSIQLNERLVVENASAGVAATYQASIFAVQDA